MTPERFQQIDKLLDQALELEPERRAAFLDQACGGDEELRRKVAAQLAAYERLGSFLAAPAIEDAARELAEDRAGLSSGREFSHYRILSLLGKGGMGEVYLAQDTSLRRKAALKLLPAHSTQDHERLRRFEQEAYAASSLNHPNIITIYEIGQFEGGHYIATEYVDGQTLRQRLAGGAMKLDEALGIAVQIAEALSAAHEASIIHRDIKPENIMLRRDGYVKVLDFGIAKLIERPQPKDESETSVKSSFETAAGVVIGTAAYMSPEQASAEKTIDARSDIFSLGVVLYEMITGLSPFAASSFAETREAILNLTPPPLLSSRPEVSPELEQTVAQAISKDREARHRTATELRDALNQIRKRLDQDAGATAAVPPAIAASPEIHPTVPYATTVAEKTAGGSKYLTVRKVIALTALLIAGIVIAVLARPLLTPGRLTFLPDKNTPGQPTFLTVQKTLTSSGKITRAAISRDGKYVVYAEKDSGRQRLLVKQIAGDEMEIASNKEVQIVGPKEDDDPTPYDYYGLTFSPDGNYVYFVRTEVGEFEGKLYRIPTFGGVKKWLIDDVDTAVTFSRDGLRIAFGRGDPDSDIFKSYLMIANADGTEQKVLKWHSWDTGFCRSGIAWSPDGNVIACNDTGIVNGGTAAGVTVVRVEDSFEQAILPSQWRVIKGLAWTADGSGLIVATAEKGWLSTQLFHLSYPAGKLTQLPHYETDYDGVSLSASGEKLLSVGMSQVSDIWKVTTDGKRKTFLAEPVAPGTGTYFDLSCSFDGSIVASASSKLDNKVDVWLIKNGSRTRLTSDPSLNFRGQLTPDNRYLVYVSNRNGTYYNIWRRDLLGGDLLQLTDGKGEYAPQITPNGEFIFYHRDDSGIWKVPLAGGTSEEFITHRARFPVISPSGKQVACQYAEDKSGVRWKLAIRPMAGGEPELFDLPEGFVSRESFIRWHPDEQALTYVLTQKGVSNIFVWPISGKPWQLTDFIEGEIFNFDWARNGRTLFLLRGIRMNNVILRMN